MRNNRTRQVRLLLNLLSFLKAQPGVKLSTLARAFRMSEPRMERLLLSQLIVCGLPPYSPTDYINIFIDEGPDGKIITLQQNEEFRQPLKLTSVEALALKTAVEAYSRAKPVEVGEAAERLLDKIRASMNDNDARALGGESFATARYSRRLQQHLDDIDAAIAGHNVIEIDYFSAEHRALHTRRMRPMELFEEGSHFYVRGHCELRNAQRTFRVGRIRAVRVFDEVFPPPEKHARWDGRAVPGWDGSRPKGQLIVRFEPFVAEDVEQEWTPRNCAMRWMKDGSLVLTLPLYSEAWALGWVLSFGQYAELLEPKRLRKQLIERVKVMRAQCV